MAVKQLAEYSFREVELIEPVEKLSRDGWIKWGIDNLYPQFLWSLYYNSPIHGGVINSKVTYIAGGGLKYTGSENWDEINANGNSKYTLDELAEQYVLDQEVGNCYYILCRKDTLTGKWKLEHIPFELMRSNESETEYYYSENWKTSQQKWEKTRFKTYISFFNRTNETTECVLFVKSASRQYRLESNILTLGYYPIPCYSGAIDSVLTDVEINYFRYSEVVNGYKGGTLLSLNNGIPESDESADKIVKDLKLSATDKRKQGGISVTFSDGKDREPSISQLNGNDLDKRYLSTETNLAKKIMIGHSVINPKLFGQMQDNSLFDSNLENDFKIFQKTYAKQKQRNIASSLTYVLQTLNGITGEIEFEQYELFDKVIVSEPQPQATFSKEVNESEVIEMFNNCGRSRSEVTILRSFDFNGESDDEAVEKFFKSEFASVNENQSKILTMLSNGESYDSIVKALGVKPVEVSKLILDLQKKGYIESNKLTDKGLSEIATKETISVVYSYEKKPTAPDLVKGGKSRPFCQALMSSEKVYTREEIDRISSAVGRDVWSYRGGWYHNPDTDVNTPSCRHYWKQNIIFG